MEDKFNHINISITEGRVCQTRDELNKRITDKFFPCVILPGLVKEIEMFARGEAQRMKEAGIIDFEWVKVYMTSDNEINVDILPRKQEVL